MKHVKATEMDENDDDKYVCDVRMDNMINDIAVESFVVSDESMIKCGVKLRHFCFEGVKSIDV